MEPTHHKTDKPEGARGLSHAAKMLLCCLVPLALLAVLAYSGVSLKGFGLLAVILLCPLLHLFMMRGSHSGRGE